MRLKPAPVNTGVIFIRSDLNSAPVKAVGANTSATGYATTLSANGATVKTVEHVLSALAGLGIDNVYAELDADEVPIMDGSAKPFVRLIADAGIRTQDAVQPVIKMTKPVFVREGDKQIAIWPSESVSISCFIDFNHPMLRGQSMDFSLSEEGFLREIADARTFGFLSEVEALRAHGLARGGSLDNAVVLGNEGVLNEGGLRHHDEFVRHKILDLIGDLSLAGMPIVGHVVAHKSGHGLNARLVAKLLQNPGSWIVLGTGEIARRPQEVRYQQAAVL
jgi:UDP-3-O-[3-hydroxymyristoyl] N-acetylglucosamine deacetylase